MAPVLASGDTAELVGARKEFRKVLKSVVVTPRAERGAFDVTVETEMAALVARGGHITKVGERTRTTRWDAFSLTLRLDA